MGSFLAGAVFVLFLVWLRKATRGEETFGEFIQRRDEDDT